MGYTGLTEEVKRELDSWRPDGNLSYDSFAHPLEGNASLQERLHAIISSVKEYPDTVVKINGVARQMGMFAKQKYAGVSMKTVTEDIAKRSFSDKTLRMIEEMSTALSANYRKSNLPVEECNADKIKHDMMTSLTPKENKEFMIRLALGTNLKFSEYVDMCSYMMNCERIDLYVKEEYLLQLVMENQQTDRFNAYNNLLEDYDEVEQVKGKETKEQLKELLDEYGTVVAGHSDKPVGQVYSKPGNKGIRKMHPEIQRRISEQKATIKFRKERSSQWVKRNLIDELTKLIKTSESYVAILAREASNNQDQLVASLRLKFEKNTKIHIPKGTAFTIQFGNDVIELTTNEDKESNENQMNRGNMDIKAYGYGKPLAGDNHVIKAGELVLLSRLPKGVKEVTNTKDIQFGNVELWVTYDPYKFVGCEPLTLWGCAGKSKQPTVKIVTETMPDPEHFSAIVPVLGNSSAIEVGKDYEQVEKQTNKWSCLIDSIGFISVATPIKAQSLNKQTVKMGELLVNSSLITSIPRGTLFIFEKKDKEEENDETALVSKNNATVEETTDEKREGVKRYYYRSTENVKDGTLKVNAQILSESLNNTKLSKQTLIIDEHDRERADQSGIISIEARKKYFLPKPLIHCFLNAMYARNIQMEEDNTNFDLLDIGDWLFEAELSPDISNPSMISRNDIITLTFLLLGLEGVYESPKRYDIFTSRVNYHLSNCFFHSFYPMNPYERLIEFMLKYLEGDDVLNAFPIIWRAAYQQRTKNTTK